MTDLPKRVDIHEEGPREGFQIEPGPIATADKVRFCEALAETGLHDVQCVSFVDPRRVPGMADAVEVAADDPPAPGRATTPPSRSTCAATSARSRRRCTSPAACR